MDVEINSDDDDDDDSDHGDLERRGSVRFFGSSMAPKTVKKQGTKKLRFL